MKKIVCIMALFFYVPFAVGCAGGNSGASPSAASILSSQEENASSSSSSQFAIPTQLPTPSNASSADEEGPPESDSAEEDLSTVLLEKITLYQEPVRIALGSAQDISKALDFVASMKFSCYSTTPSMGGGIEVRISQDGQENIYVFKMDGLSKDLQNPDISMWYESAEGAYDFFDSFFPPPDDAESPGPTYEKGLPHVVLISETKKYEDNVLPLYNAVDIKAILSIVDSMEFSCYLEDPPEEGGIKVKITKDGEVKRYVFKPNGLARDLQNSDETAWSQCIEGAYETLESYFKPI